MVAPREGGVDGNWKETVEVEEKLSRTPRGVRGLQLLRLYIAEKPSLSPPLRGAWIETFSVFVNPKVVRVAPRTGRVD